MFFLRLLHVEPKLELDHITITICGLWRAGAVSHR
jgi:hypothetical protein